MHIGLSECVGLWILNISTLVMVLLLLATDRHTGLIVLTYAVVNLGFWLVWTYDLQTTNWGTRRTR